MSNLTRIKNNQVTDSTIVASAKLVPGSITGGLFSDPISYSGSMTIVGNLTVQGTTTTVDTTNTLVADPVIVLSRGETGSPSNDSGFLVERGTSDNAAFLWDETNDRFEAITTTDDGLSGGSITVADYADIKMRDAILTGGDITSTVSTVNVFNATATTVNFAGAATTLEIGAATGTTNINNNLDVDGNINMDGGSITTTAATVNIANANSTTVNFAGAATTLEIGAATGTTNINNNLDVDGNINLDGGNFTTTAATVNIANANSTTVNFAGAATTLEIGAATGTTNINNSLDVDGNLNVDGTDITTTAATVNIANANTTTLNIGGAATTTNIGNSGGNVVVAGDLRVNGNQFLSSTGNAAISLSDIDVIIHGNLTVQGATTTIGSQDLTVEDSIINLHTQPNLAPLTSDDGRDIGVKFHYYKSSDKHAFVGWANDSGFLEYYSDATESAGVISGTYGTIKANTFNSNVATGTAPLSVNSTTQVANLNVEFSGTLINGTSNVDIASTNGNVTVGVAGNANIAVFNATGVDLSNLNITANTIASLGTNANINLTPNGTGEVVAATLAVTDLSANRIVYSADNAGTLTDTANLTFDGSQMVLTGTYVVAGPSTLGNINIQSNTISSVNSNGDINLDPNGIGAVVVNNSGDDTEFIVRGNNTATSNEPIIYTYYNQLGILTNNLVPNVSVYINATDSIVVPKGTTGQRPGSGTEVAGMIRFNTSNGFLEFYDGSTWQSTSGSFTVINYQNFSGDGSTLGFTLSSTSTTAATLVAINGVLQQPTTAYSVSGTSLSFTEAPLAGDDIDVRLMTTTTTVVSLAEGDSSVTVADSGTGTVTFTLDGSARWLSTGNTIRPNSNNAVSLGTASYQWANVNAVAININGVPAASTDDATALAIALG